MRISRPSTSRAKLADRAHVPDVIFVSVHRALGRHHVERGDADVPQRLDGPAVVAIRPRKPFGKLQTNLGDVRGEPRCRYPARRRSRAPARFRPGRTRAAAPTAAYCCANKLLRLRRPRHQLAVEADPVGVQSLPEARCVEGGRAPSPAAPLQRGILEEPTTGARVADATLVFEDAEALAGDVLDPGTR